MRVMALDIGQKRIGIAISDPDGHVASPVCVLPANEVFQHAPSFVRVLQDWEPELLVSGLPRELSGRNGQQATRIKKQAHQIAERCHLPLQFVDERLSSQSAKRILRERGLSERDMRGKVDSIAASIFLQTWLDAQNNEHSHIHDVNQKL